MQISPHMEYVTEVSHAKRRWPRSQGLEVRLKRRRKTATVVCLLKSKSLTIPYDMILVDYFYFLINLIRRTATKGKNKGKVFYNCPKPIKEQCHYYRWKGDKR